MPRVIPIKSNYCKIVIGLLLMFPLVADSYAIVFVHLGKVIPEYLFEAVSQARRFNDEDTKIIVIAEQRALDKVNKQSIEGYQIDFIACETLHESEEHKSFRKVSSLNESFREGFWVKCTERFFYLDELMRQHDLHDVFHLEYDNMLYVNLKELLPAFHTYTNIAATFDSDNRCVPGFMYFAQPNSLQKLVSYIAKMAAKGHNDMKVIALYKKNHSSIEIDNLPIIMPEYVHEYGLRNALGNKAQRPSDYVHHIDAFNSIFDGAALGQFLGGIDPRNGQSKPGFVNETCLFNASKLTYTWHKDERGKRVPYASCGQKLYRINNLHIHSKNLKAFAS